MIRMVVKYLAVDGKALRERGATKCHGRSLLGPCTVIRHPMVCQWKNQDFKDQGAGQKNDAMGPL